MRLVDPVPSAAFDDTVFVVHCSKTLWAGAPLPLLQVMYAYVVSAMTRKRA